MATIQDVLVPDIGDFSDVDVIEVLVAPGDRVNEEDSLITLESDKASMDIPSPMSGTVKEVLINPGDKVSQGTLIVRLEAGGGAAAEAPAPAASAPTSPPGPVGGGEQEIAVPDIGDFSDVDVIEVHVAVGDAVAVDDSLITLESDKASMDIPAPVAGVIKNIKIAVGDKVSQGTPLAVVELAGDGTKPPPAAAAESPKAPPQPETASPAPEVATPPPPPPSRQPPVPPVTKVDEAGFSKAHASPAVRSFARELGVDLGRVTGSGRKSRITKADVQLFVKQVMSGQAAAPAGAAAPEGGAGIPPIPAVDFTKFGEIETKDLSRIKKISGAHLHRCWLNIPMVTHHDEADITDLEEFRKSLKVEAEKRGVRVTALTFIMKAVVGALKAFPDFNASLSPDGQSLIYKKYYHVGIAVDTPNGLVVPVFRDVDQKSIYDLAAEMAEVSKRARDGKLTPTEMQGGCISISSLGGIGGTAFTPLVNAPEVSILGVTRSRMMPVWNGSEFVPRLMLPLDLTYDHRVIDGASAARFVAYLTQVLADMRRLLL